MARIIITSFRFTRQRGENLNHYRDDYKIKGHAYYSGERENPETRMPWNTAVRKNRTGASLFLFTVHKDGKIPVISFYFELTELTFTCLRMSKLFV